METVIEAGAHKGVRLLTSWGAKIHLERRAF